MAISWDSCIVFLKLARFFVVAWSIFATGRICIQIWYHVQAAVNITAQTTAATASYTFGTSIGSGLERCAQPYSSTSWRQILSGLERCA